MKKFLCCMLEWGRRHIILALTMKFIAGLVIGFGLGVYFLPIIIADAPAEKAVLVEAEKSAALEAVFRRDLPGSDAGHWGEGTLLLGDGRATLMGEVSPGPDYRLYLAPEYAENEEQFFAIKDASREIARIKGFENFSYEVAGDIDYGQYKAVVIWCERFSQFITAGRLVAR